MDRTFDVAYRYGSRAKGAQKNHYQNYYNRFATKDVRVYVEPFRQPCFVHVGLANQHATLNSNPSRPSYFKLKPFHSVPSASVVAFIRVRGYYVFAGFSSHQPNSRVAPKPLLMIFRGPSKTTQTPVITLQNVLLI